MTIPKDTFVCLVRSVAGAGPAQAEASNVEELVARVEDEARRWGPQICGYLGRQPSRPVTITLRPGSGFAMTKGRHILLPVNANPATLAALSHELVHAVVNATMGTGTPGQEGRCASRVADEGVAVHVDALLRLGGDVWPFYHLAPHRWVALFSEDGLGLTLGELIGGDGPGGAWDALWDAGQDPGQPAARAATARRFYLHAGSYVGFVIEQFGVDAFWEMFSAGRAIPAGGDIATLDGDWVRALGGSPSPTDRRLRDESLATIARRGAERVWARSTTGVPPSGGRR